MKKYKIYFTHVVDMKYEAVIEANTQHEAKEIWEEAPFDYIINDGDEDGGRNIELDAIEEIKE